MITESLRVDAGGPGLQALVARSVGLDASASARFRQLTEDSVDVFVTTPFEVVASRRIRGVASRDGAVVAATDLLTALENDVEEVGPARDPNWPGALPPAGGFRLLDTLR